MRKPEFVHVIYIQSTVKKIWEAFRHEIFARGKLSALSELKRQLEKRDE